MKYLFEPKWFKLGILYRNLAIPSIHEITTGLDITDKVTLTSMRTLNNSSRRYRLLHLKQCTNAQHAEMLYYRVTQKWHIFWYALTSSNINRFSKLLHCRNQEKTCNYTITKDPTTPQACRYTALWNVKCLKSNNWKRDDFCNNTF